MSKNYKLLSKPHIIRMDFSFDVWKQLHQMKPQPKVNAQIHPYEHPFAYKCEVMKTQRYSLKIIKRCSD